MALRLARIPFVGDCTVTNRDNADGLPPVGELIEDSISAYAQGIKPAQPASERVTGSRFALQQPESVLDRVYQRPAQLEQLATRAAGEDEPRHRSASGGPALGQLAAELGEGYRLPALYLGKSRLQRGEGVGIGQDLGGLLQRLVLVDRNQRRGRSAVPGHQNVIAPIADVIEQAAEVAA